MQEVDFSDAELISASFDDCDLSRAIFENTNLQKADFRSANNFNINPENNQLAGAKFSFEGLPGLLAKHKIVVK